MEPWFSVDTAGNITVFHGFVDSRVFPGGPECHLRTVHRLLIGQS